MRVQRKVVEPVAVVILSARADADFAAALEKHLAGLVRRGRVQVWQREKLAARLDDFSRIAAGQLFFFRMHFVK